jgi:hypothetical protein
MMLYHTCRAASRPRANVITQYSVEMGAEALDCPPAGYVEARRPKFHRNARQPFKRMFQQHEFTLGETEG